MVEPLKVRLRRCCRIALGDRDPPFRGRAFIRFGGSSWMEVNDGVTKTLAAIPSGSIHFFGNCIRGCRSCLAQPPGCCGCDGFAIWDELKRVSKKSCSRRNGASRGVVKCRQQDADDGGQDARAPRIHRTFQTPSQREIHFFQSIHEAGDPVLEEQLSRSRFERLCTYVILFHFY